MYLRWYFFIRKSSSWRIGLFFWVRLFFGNVYLTNESKFTNISGNSLNGDNALLILSSVAGPLDPHIEEDGEDDEDPNHEGDSDHLVKKIVLTYQSPLLSP